MEILQSTTSDSSQSGMGLGPAGTKGRMGVRRIGITVSSLKTHAVSKVFRIYGNRLNREEKREEGRKKERKEYDQDGYCAFS